MLLPPVIGTAIPVVKTLSECASYSHTIEPYLPQLYSLPEQIWTHITDPVALRNVYVATNPVISGLAFSIALFPIFLVVSEVNRNWSQVDRVWSILPTLYHIHYAVWGRMSGLNTDKVDKILLFSLLWTTRLTYNYWRRGGYQIGSEDYRWNLIKGWIGTPAFFVLNVLFTSSIQSVLLFAVTTPTYLMLLSSRLEPNFTPLQLTLSRALIPLIGLEWLADGQQWAFHEAKATYQKTAKVPQGYTRAQLERGFNTTGMFKYSRHPNFAAEQSIWVLLYVIGALVTGEWFNWTAFGMLQYLGVFAGSTPLTEWISAGKYPEYKIYQKRVGKFLPWPFGKGWNEKEMEVLGPKVAEEARKEKAKKGQ
ncbi:hypothetical protein LTR95_009258 [Oleoguttula sp. CCFEE 5521]